MKNPFKLLFCFILLTVFILIIASCDSSAQGNSHTHEYGEWKIIQNPTCAEGGIQERYCSCGKSETENILPLAHTVVLDRASSPTCTQTGLTEGEHCSVCNQILKEQEIISATGHTEAVDHGTPATCTQTGLTDGRHCTVCQEILAEQQVIPALGHTVEIDIAVSSTCTSTGLTEGRHCSVCLAVLVRQNITEKKAHSWVTDHAVSPTCSKNGLTEGCHCQSCGEVKIRQKSIKQLPHTPISVEELLPTCTNSGNKSGERCSVCNEIISGCDSISPLGHNFIKATNTCSRCPEKEYQEISSRNELLEYDQNSDAVIYLDKCISVQDTSEYWTLTILPDAKLVRLVGTPNVTYNVHIVVEATRESALTLEFVDAALKAKIKDPVIDIEDSGTVNLKFYGTSCALIGKDGGTESDPTINGGDGEDGKIAVNSQGNVNITVAADFVQIRGGNGGKGGDGSGAGVAPIDGGDGGDGGDGSYAIYASSINIYGDEGHLSSEIQLSGGEGGKGGSGGAGFFWKEDGRDGEDGNSSISTNITPVYH